jgi:hypothetical protein
MKKLTRQMSIVTAILWASAILAAAIVKAPTFFTILLLPLLAFSSLSSIEFIARRGNAGSRICS